MMSSQKSNDGHVTCMHSNMPLITPAQQNGLRHYSPVLVLVCTALGEMGATDQTKTLRLDRSAYPDDSKYVLILIHILHIDLERLQARRTSASFLNSLIRPSSIH